VVVVQQITKAGLEGGGDNQGGGGMTKDWAVEVVAGLTAKEGIERWWWFD